ncbi:hypothetical protein BurJ1DRAFT_4618 [Burkholderiales bacterium JOSHI_001]|nr:hypothetical protein BurJ1DRAFT_4618 [Burkholderiales bacterium JOSHI_001]
MANFRIPGPAGVGGYTLEVDAGTATLSGTPRPGAVGLSTAASGEPPTGLLYSKRYWRTLADGTVNDIRNREGRWPDGELMAPSLLRSQRMLYVQRWREAVLASGAESEIAAYWAMLCERMAELLALFDSERGRYLLMLDKLTRSKAQDPREKHKQLREALTGWFSLLHDQAVTGRGMGPDGQYAAGEEEKEIVRAAMSEQLRLANGLNRQELQQLTQQAEGVARQPPAEDLMARRQQREALEKLISGGPPAKGAPDDGLPHHLTGLFQYVLGLERQDQLLGGGQGGEDWDDLKGEAGELAKAAAKVVKKLRVDAAKQNIADARKRIAEHARLSDKVARLKSEVLIREQLSEGLQQVLGLERQRQLLGVGESGAAPDEAGGVGAVGAALTINADDQELNRLAQEGAKLYAEFKKGDASEVQGLLDSLASAPGKPLP